jgi:hypothetical protein
MRTTKFSSLVSVVRARQRVIFPVFDSRSSRSLELVCLRCGRRRRKSQDHRGNGIFLLLYSVSGWTGDLGTHGVTFAVLIGSDKALAFSKRLMK